MSRTVWSKFADAKKNIACIRVPYPSALLQIHRERAKGCSVERDIELEQQAKPFLEQFLENNGLVWNEVACGGDISMETFVAFFDAAGYLITPVDCYTTISSSAKYVTLSLDQIPKPGRVSTAFVPTTCSG